MGRSNKEQREGVGNSEPVKRGLEALKGGRRRQLDDAIDQMEAGNSARRKRKKKDEYNEEESE